MRSDSTHRQFTVELSCPRPWYSSDCRVGRTQQWHIDRLAADPTRVGLDGGMVAVEMTPRRARIQVIVTVVSTADTVRYGTQNWADTARAVRHAEKLLLMYLQQCQCPVSAVPGPIRASVTEATSEARA